MADFKLGVAGSEYDLPTCVVEELPTDQEDSCETIEMQDGSLQANFRTTVPQTHEIEFDWLTLTEAQLLQTLNGLHQVLNYINGYKGITGTSVVIQNLAGPTLIVATSGLAVPRYRATLTLRTV